MKEKKEEIAVADQEVVNDYTVFLSKEYPFEEKTISKLNFLGLETMTANDMINANKVLVKSGSIVAVPELDLEYALIIAANATKVPIEFFKRLTPRDAIRVKNKVTSFFYGEE